MYQSVEPQNITTNKKLIISLFEAIDFSNWKLLVQHFDQDIIYERPGYKTLNGINQLLYFYQHERVIASGKHYLEHIVVEQEYGCCWGQFIGLHKNGSQINERFADVYSFERSRLKTRRSHFFRPAV